MFQTITDFYKYTRYHFFEASVYEGSSLPYKLWALKRIIKVLISGRKNSETYLYPKDVIIKNKEGLFFVPRQTDLILNISSKTEGHLIPYFTIENGKTFLDIGANAGKWSIHIAKSCVDNKIIAFEPIPSTFAVIKKNIALNNLQNQVSLFNIGLSHQNAVINFALNAHFTGVNGVYQDDITSLPEGFELIKVPVKKLDDVLLEGRTEISAIDLVKIDVEGHELSVIKGALNTFKSLNPGTRLLIEIDRNSSSKNATLQLLSDLRFTKITQLDSINYLIEKEMN